MHFIKNWQLIRHLICIWNDDHSSTAPHKSLLIISSAVRASRDLSGAGAQKEAFPLKFPPPPSPQVSISQGSEGMCSDVLANTKVLYQTPFYCLQSGSQAKAVKSGQECSILQSVRCHDYLFILQDIVTI